MNDLEMHWDKAKVVLYDTARTRLEGWFTLQEIREVVQTMEYLNAAAKHSMKANHDETN
jgi:hypothetical protein